MSKLTGSEIVIECLKEQGVDTVFGYPAKISYLRQEGMSRQKEWVSNPSLSKIPR